MIPFTDCLNAKGNPVSTSKSVNKSNKPKKPDSAPVPVVAETPNVAAGFNIVGIGASAGGLEAFEQFFRTIPPDSGMAFVLVSHLDPDHASLLTEILQRATTMPVIEAQDQMKVSPNHVYVLPPNCEMAIFHGALQLSEPEMPRGQRMVIDAFQRSLADAKRAELPSSAASFSPAARSRSAMTTEPPSAASSRAVAAPSSDAPPVTRKT